jgi:hypothetical protein
MAAHGGSRSELGSDARISPSGENGRLRRLPTIPDSRFPASLRREEIAAVLVDQLERTAAAARHAGQRIVRDDDRQTGFLRQKLVDVAQQRAAAGEYDAALRDVRAELRRSLLERLLDRADDALQRLLQRLEDLVAIQT